MTRKNRPQGEVQHHLEIHQEASCKHAITKASNRRGKDMPHEISSTFLLRINNFLVNQSIRLKIIPFSFPR